MTATPARAGTGSFQARDDIGSFRARDVIGSFRARDVIGGDVAGAGRFPWAVRLSMGCGGALTAPRVVLTAGHCAGPSGPNTRITVTAGATDLKARSAITVRSVAVFRSPDFVTETSGDDWAVIRLDRELAVPTLPITRENVDTGEFTVMGWGQTRETALRQERRLHYATVPAIPDKQCAAAYRKFGVKLVEDESICAGRHGVDTCQGDSGGPMVGRDRSGRWTQIGIVSWGLGCARDGYFGVYTQIAKFRAEIEEATSRFS
ncbi:S1 family serine peptidase [Actinoplanes couchii]|uniref:S1 family serine peptidase n=1 Tax=Actinoplanes couchii TaxID=403638 RepID=UPI001EF25AAC|nr:serine protease [Actinoplanes couchii]MDR6325168.1 secreted trypsin-like serine protease [Actinoplanes couchii]